MPPPASVPAVGPQGGRLQGPPPAAVIVAEGTRTERELELEEELQAERTTRRNRELTIAELEDENFRLKTPPAPAPARPLYRPVKVLERPPQERRIGPVIRFEV